MGYVSHSNSTINFYRLESGILRPSISFTVICGSIDMSNKDAADHSIISNARELDEQGQAHPVIHKRRICIAAPVGRDPMTVSRVWSRWVQDGDTERQAGSQQFPITSSQEDRNVTRISLRDREATSRALSQELGPFTRQQVSTRTVRRRLLHHRYSARKSWL
ncbi:HTH_Tnp_Tc3_2 domain-containing protein [Trichonephila clavipes]|nr:HTH_Tnp_Tc3_2 domain-containing protein [Trichonephila clavipes]